MLCCSPEGELTMKLKLAVLSALLIALLATPIAAVAQQVGLGANLDAAIVLHSQDINLVDADATSASANGYSITAPVDDIKTMLQLYDSEYFYIVLKIKSYDGYKGTVPSLQINLYKESPTYALYTTTWYTISQPYTNFIVSREALESLVQYAEAGSPVKIVIALYNYDTSSTAADTYVLVKISKVLLAPPEGAEPKLTENTTTVSEVEELGAGMGAASLALAAAIAAVAAGAVVFVLSRR